MYGKVIQAKNGIAIVLGEDGKKYTATENRINISVGALVTMEVLSESKTRLIAKNLKSISPRPCSMEQLNCIARWSQEATSENESNLYLESKFTREVLENNKLIVLGRKGSGKSALAQNLITSGEFVAGSFSFEHVPFERFYALKDLNGATHSQYMTIWQILYISFSLSLLNESEKSSSQLKEAIHNHFDSKSKKGSVHKIGDLIRTATHSAIGRISGSVISFTGSFIDPVAIINTIFDELSAENAINSEKSENRLPSILRELKQFYISLPDKQKVMVVFDQLDEEYNENSKDGPYGDMLRCLFTASVEIYKEKMGITPLVLLREDIFDSFNGSNKEKLTDYIITLNWDKDEIKRIITHRLAKSLNGSDSGFEGIWLSLFPPFYEIVKKSGTNVVSSFEWFVRHTTRTPRDCVMLLKLISETLRNQNKNNCDIRDFDKASRYLGEYFVGQMVNAVSPVVPCINQFVSFLQENLTDVVNRKDNFCLLIADFNSQHSNCKIDERPLLTALYDQSAIMILAQDNQIRAKHLGNKTYFAKQSDRIVIHSAFAIYLELKGTSDKYILEDYEASLEQNTDNMLDESDQFIPRYPKYFLDNDITRSEIEKTLGSKQWEMTFVKKIGNKGFGCLAHPEFPDNVVCSIREIFGVEELGINTKVSVVVGINTSPSNNKWQYSAIQGRIIENRS